MAKVNFRLLDETGKATEVTGEIHSHPDGVYVDFDSDRIAGPRIGIQLYDGKLDVFVFAKGDQDEPTHKINLDVPISPQGVEAQTQMMYRQLGNTGFGTSALGLGGESALYRRSDEAVAIIERALELGVNYFDTAPLYQESELNYGEVLPKRRREMFIATKTDQRGYDDAWRQFERSLQRLKVDHVDLLQVHHLDTMEEVDAIFQDDGAVRMVQEAKDQGLASFIGVTGHTDPEVLLAAIDRHPFDAILMALNPAEVHVHSFQERLLPRAVDLGMAIMAMKVVARGKLLELTGWGADAPLSYVLSLPVSNAVLGVMNKEQLERNVQIVSAFLETGPVTPAEMRAMEEATAPYAREVNFYRKGLENVSFPAPPEMMTEAR